MFTSTVLSPEQVAESLVVVGHSDVELRAPGVPPLKVCSHPNRGLLKDQAERLREFIAAVIRAEREGA